MTFRMLAGTLAAVPLILAPQWLLFDVTPKLLVLLAGACGVWLALAVEGSFAVSNQEVARFWRLLAGLAAAGTLASVFSTDWVLSLVGSEWRRMGLPSWLACLALAAAVPVVIAGNHARRRRLVAVIALTAVVASVYGLAQYLGRDPWIPSRLYSSGQGASHVSRPPSSLGHVSYFAAFSVSGGFAAAGLALSASSMAKRVGWGVGTVTIALALMIAGSRGAWLGGAAGAAVLLAHVRRSRALLALLLSATAIAGLFLLSPAGRGVRNRIRLFGEEPGVGVRLLVWRDTLNLILQHPLLGAGPDTFEIVFPQFESLALARRAPDHYIESPHNVLLDYLTTAGIPAALLFVLIAGFALRNFSTLSRSAPSERAPLEAGLLAALVATLVAAQFIADSIPTRLLLLVLAAISVHAPVHRAQPVARVLVAAISVLFLGAVVLFGTELASAEQSARRVSVALAGGDLETAIQQGSAARRAFPWTGTYTFAYSRALNQAVVNAALPPQQRALLLAMSEDAARSALPHSARPQMVLLHLGAIRGSQGRLDEAQRDLEAAVRAAPSWHRPRWMLAVLLSERGRYFDAADAALAALQRGAGRNPEAARSCVEIHQLALDSKTLGEPSGHPDAPAIYSAGIVNAASFAPGRILAPGSLISVFGRNLAQGQESARLPLKTALAGSTVTIGGRQIPLLFAAPGQINAQLPFDLPIGSRLAVTIRTRKDDGRELVAVSEPTYIAAVRPGIFTVNGQGTGQAAALDVRGRLVDASAAAQPGAFVQVFCTGLGVTDPPVLPGKAAPANPPARVVIPVQVLLDGHQATVHFAGLAPGFAGLYQVNFQVPEGVGPGPALPLVLVQEGISSNIVTVAVAGPKAR